MDESPSETLSENALLPVADGLPTRQSGPWVAEKLFYVERYISIFTTAMRTKPWRSRRYLDLFAGPGKCQIRGDDTFMLGSPLIAVNTAYPFTDYIFVDTVNENTEAIKSRCESAGVSANIQYLTGDANRLIDTIVDPIIEHDSLTIPGKWGSLNLAFLDPEGLEIEWETIAALASVERMDLIIHYSQSGLTRNLERCAELGEGTVVDRFFGDLIWRQIYYGQRERGASHGSIHRALIDHYKSKLAKLGYVEVVDHEITSEPLIRNISRKAPLYRLLFASKHRLGNKFWSEVTKKNVYGQKSLF